MTDEEFQKEVHEYSTTDRREALLKAMEYQNASVDAVAVDFGRLGFCLMLADAASGLPVVSIRLSLDDAHLGYAEENKTVADKTVA